MATIGKDFLVNLSDFDFTPSRPTDLSRAQGSAQPVATNEALQGLMNSVKKQIAFFEETTVGCVYARAGCARTPFEDRLSFGPIEASGGGAVWPTRVSNLRHFHIALGVLCGPHRARPVLLDVAAAVLSRAYCADRVCAQVQKADRGVA